MVKTGTHDAKVVVVTFEEEHNFVKAFYSVSYGVPYDFKSIMHYRLDAWSKNDYNTIRVKQDYVQDIDMIGHYEHLSSNDVELANK